MAIVSLVALYTQVVAVRVHRLKRMSCVHATKSDAIHSLDENTFARFDMERVDFSFACGGFFSSCPSKQLFVHESYLVRRGECIYSQSRTFVCTFGNVKVTNSCEWCAHKNRSNTWIHSHTQTHTGIHTFTRTDVKSVCRENNIDMPGTSDKKSNN